MQELFERIKGNDSNLIIIRETIYSSSCINYIPLLQIDEDGVVWVFLNLQVINDLKRLVKRVNKMGLTWFYRSSGLRFDAVMSTSGAKFMNYEELIQFSCKVESWNFHIAVDNVEKLGVFEKVMEMCSYYDDRNLVIEVIDSFEFTTKKHYVHQGKFKRIHDKDGKVKRFRRSLQLSSIIDDII